MKLNKEQLRDLDVQGYLFFDGTPLAQGRRIAAGGDAQGLRHGPLLFIRKSHREGILQAGHGMETPASPLWTLDRSNVRNSPKRAASTRRWGRPAPP